MKNLLFITAISLLTLKVQAQNVGIGTTQPGTQLHIAGTNLYDTARGAIMMSRYWLNSTDTRSSAIYHLYNSTIGKDQLVLGVSGDGGVNTSPALYSNAKMVIQANGAVGIGTSNPLQKLHVEGTTFLNGNVGIGTATPNAPLSFPPVLGKKITLYPGATGDAGMAVQGNLFQIYSDNPSADIAFGYDVGGTMTERMRIKANGNVGIGTIYPNAPLGFSAAYGKKISFYSGGVSDAGLAVGESLLQMYSAGYGTAIAFGYDQEGVFTERMRIGGNGNVGIGTTSPSARLHVSAGDASLALFGPNSYGGQLYVGASNNQNAALTAQVISSDGNLHIDPAPGKNIYLGYYQPRDIFMNPFGGKVVVGTSSPPTTTLEVNGYTKLGSDAPSIKFKKLTGITAATEGGGVLIALGLTTSKILAVSVLVAPSANVVYPANASSIGYNFRWFITVGGEIYVENVSGQSVQILSKPITILITYEE